MNETQASQLPVYAGNDLGAVWRSSATAFRLWAPTACSAALHRFATGTDAEPEAADLGTLAMQRSEGGTWYLELAGDLAGQYYQYELQFPDETSTVTADPYAHAAGAGGTRSMVLNQAAAVPDGWQKDERPAIPAHARSVWEVHVADFTADPASGVPQAYRGKFMGFTVDGTTLNGDGVHPTGLNYLKRLGVTHVQLQPIFDFATVDEVSGEDYNWGYDPLNYNLPEGSYATDAFHGEVRVRECRAMVQALHSAGLGVVMDVVYNHTYYSNSWLERTVPGYWNRRWENGSLTNGSGCGCDLASERTMVRKYLVDSCVYWAKEYHIDGFRFDLMALHDVETMNAIRAALDALPGGEDQGMKPHGDNGLHPGQGADDGPGAACIIQEVVGNFQSGGGQPSGHRVQMLFHGGEHRRQAVGLVGVLGRLAEEGGLFLKALPVPQGEAQIVSAGRNAGAQQDAVDLVRVGGRQGQGWVRR